MAPDFNPGPSLSARNTHRSAGATPNHSWRTRGFTLIELLCVMAIISILVGLMLPPMAKALRKARGLAGVVGPGAGGGGYSAVYDDIRTAYQDFRLKNPGHGVLRRNDFIRQCKLSSRAEEWIKMSSVVYHPFSANSPPSQVVLEVLASGIHGEVRILHTVQDLLSQ